ncbi:Predicted amidohydrolase [Cyclobacterium xiamenense]|uniref:Predicted amidohydrolase n=1 Tax=Cyclobacterium xiamenense TaxID=1297121 RepID=A0A1H6YY89_9BACT|nr:nitrilase family protein [Cyclobacterium xiamenense]SEJ46171.1 Predicted amidohydrolase [Cyclobacterium xiamenense]
MERKKNVTIASAQFENASGDKEKNLDTIEKLSQSAAAEGADVIAFHECSVTGYTFARKLDKEQLLDLAEFVPDGPSTRRLVEIAGKYGIVILAGLFEKDTSGAVFKCYVCVDGNGLRARYHKLHPFINPHITPGSAYCVFELHGWKCGILICYDNNIVENVRATSLLGAEIIFMPHVTMCTPSTRPGAGFVDPALWQNRHKDPTSLRIEFDGMKGRQWLMKWLPSRAYDNGIYAVFSNPIGMDDDQLKNGCSMILDPFGDVIAECRKLDNDFCLATLDPEKLQQAGGFRYKNARRPVLYRDIIGKEHASTQKVAWINDRKNKE